MPFNIIKSIIISPFKIFPAGQKLGPAPKIVSYALGTGSTRQGKLHKCAINVLPSQPWTPSL